MQDFPIDAVLPWVDGSDRELSARRAKYAAGDALSNDEVGGETRYASLGEVKYCVASMLRFAPFVRKIFIVTDGQDPGLGPMLERYFPDRVEDVVIVDHKVIFRGREQFLPTFNSNSIDTLIWNIPELSEHFIYTNDDVMFIRPTTPADFFRPEGTVCYATRFPVFFERLLRALRPEHIGYKASMLRAFELGGEGGSHFINLGHAPCPLLKSWYEDWARRRPDMVELNLRDKFRSLSQFEAQEPFLLDMDRKGQLVLISDREASFYFKRHGGKDYVARKLQSFDNDRTRKFVCFNSLNLCTPEEARQVLAWLGNRIDIA